MAVKQILLLDMTGATSVSGVDRYMEMIAEYMDLVEWKDDIRVFRVCLISDNNRLRPSFEDRGIKTIYTPLPSYVDAIVEEGIWMQRYGTHVLRILGEYIDTNLPTIIHIHTLNLIDIALDLKKKIKRSCIITHLHCIPWKGWIERENMAPFLRLYSHYYDSAGEIDPEQFRTNRSELESYNQADHIVCLTECAQDFVSRMSKKKIGSVRIIPNGISDLSGGAKCFYDVLDKVKLVFVGVLSKGKGILHVLQAMRIAQQMGVTLQLDVAGAYSDDIVERIQEDYQDLRIHLHGSLNREEVVSLYRQADIGIIASLQEQCSYVAIEMAMMGLPIITTAIDGLDEMFTDSVDALKIPVSYSRVKGLVPDIDYMAECIVRLSRDKNLREQIGTGARTLYQEKYTLERMGRGMFELYMEVFSVI